MLVKFPLCHSVTSDNFTNVSYLVSYYTPLYGISFLFYPPVYRTLQKNTPLSQVVDHVHLFRTTILTTTRNSTDTVLNTVFHTQQKIFCLYLLTNRLIRICFCLYFVFRFISLHTSSHFYLLCHVFGRKVSEALSTHKPISKTSYLFCSLKCYAD